mgnify:CR=1 FL=1
MKSLFDIQGKTALVTGGSSGIGAMIARGFVENGVKTYISARKEDRLRAMADELSKIGTCIPIAADLSRMEGVESLISQVQAQEDHLDILVNNAGIIRDGFISNISEQDWDSVLDVNLKAAFLCCQAVFPIMKAQQAGKIVNIASRAWLGNIGQANYSASKGGLVSLTRTLALEFARYQINVNAVAPGLIDTPMTQGMPDSARERLVSMQPTGKMGRVEDIAAAVRFLASEEAQFITGQVLHVDGGKSCGLLSL